MAALLEHYPCRPLTERILPEVGSELRAAPSLSLIGGEDNFRDPVTAIESNAAEHERVPGGNLGAIGMARDEGADIHQMDRHGGGRLRARLNTGARIASQ